MPGIGGFTFVARARIIDPIRPAQGDCAMNQTSGTCWHCGQPLAASDYGREARCPGCGKATHACRNCRFYRPGISNDCQEPVADHVADKTRANFCDYFTPNPGASADSGTRESADDLLAAAEALFKSGD